MSLFGSDQPQQARLGLLTQLQDDRSRRLAQVTACLADPAFRATTSADDAALLLNHQAALEKIILLIERQRTEMQALVNDLERADPPSRQPLGLLHRYLLWR
jgi:hypothetical protein